MTAVLLAVVALSAACSELDQQAVYQPRQPPSRPDRPVSSPAMQTPAAEPAPVAAAPRDACGAAAHQHLIGKNRSEIPIPLNPAQRRVACTTCPITEDFSPSRLNFFYDAKTGLITEVRCG